MADDTKRKSDLSYFTYLRNFGRTISGGGQLAATDLSVDGDPELTLAAVLGVLDAKATPAALNTRAEVARRIASYNA